MTDEHDNQPDAGPGSIDDLLAAMDEVDTSRPSQDEHGDDAGASRDAADATGGADDDANASDRDAGGTSDDAPVDDNPSLDDSPALEDDVPTDASGATVVDDLDWASDAPPEPGGAGAASPSGEPDAVDAVPESGETTLRPLTPEEAAADLGLAEDDLTAGAEPEPETVSDVQAVADDDDNLGLGDLPPAAEQSDDGEIGAADGTFADNFDVDAFLTEVTEAGTAAEASAAAAVEAERAAQAEAEEASRRQREEAARVAIARGDMPDLDDAPVGPARIDAAAAPRRSATVERSEVADDELGPGITVQFPSNDFPRPPAFRIRIPDEWLAVPVPDAEMAVRAAEPVDGFHPNVVVRVMRIPVTASPAETLLRATQPELLKPGIEVLSDEVRTEGPTPARRVLIKYAAPDATWVLARQLVVHVPAAERVSNLVSIVGTWAEASGEEMQQVIDGMVASLQIRP